MYINRLGYLKIGLHTAYYMIHVYIIYIIYDIYMCLQFYYISVLFVLFLVRDGVEGIFSIRAHLRWKGNIQSKFVSLWFRISYTFKRCTFIVVPYQYIPFLYHLLHTWMELHQTSSNCAQAIASLAMTRCSCVISVLEVP